MLLKCSYSSCNCSGSSDDDAESNCSLPIDECENDSNDEKFSISVNEYDSIRIELPNLLWNGYCNNVKSFFLSKSGDTVTLTGDWKKERPFLCGGPLNGAYLFSEIHFHVPSEHLLNERRYPMEMHAVHYKSSYLTGERALKEKDGTLVVVYLFEVGDTNETAISSITDTLLKKKYLNNLSKTELNICNLAQLVKHFYTNYFIYTGKGTTHDHIFELQWMISCQRFIISKEELNDMECCLQNRRTSELPRKVVKVKHLFLVGDTVVQDDVEMQNKSQVQFVECKEKEKAKSSTNIRTEKSECNCKKRKKSASKETWTDEDSFFVDINKTSVVLENKYSQTSATLLSGTNDEKSSDACESEENADFDGEGKINKMLIKDSLVMRMHQNAEEKTNKVITNHEEHKSNDKKHYEAARSLDKSEERTITFGGVLREEPEKADRGNKDERSSAKTKNKSVTITGASGKKDKTEGKTAENSEQKTKKPDAKEKKKRSVKDSKTRSNAESKNLKNSKSDSDSESGIDDASGASSVNLNATTRSVQCFTSLIDYKQFPVERIPVYSSDSDLDAITYGTSNPQSELKSSRIKLCDAYTSTKSILFPVHKMTNFSETVNTERAQLINIVPCLNQKQQKFDVGRQQKYDTMMLVLNHDLNTSRIFHTTYSSFVQILGQIEQVGVDIRKCEIKLLEHSTLHKMEKNNLQKCYTLEKNIENNMETSLDIQHKEKESESVFVMASSNSNENRRKMLGQGSEKFHVNFSAIPPHLTNSVHSIGLIIDSEIPETEKIHRQEDLNESIKSRSSNDTRRSEDNEVFLDCDRRREAESRNEEKQRVVSKSEQIEIANGSRTDFVPFGNVKKITSKIQTVSSYSPAELKRLNTSDEDEKNIDSQNEENTSKSRNDCQSDGGSKESHSTNLFQIEKSEGRSDSKDDRKIIITAKEENENQKTGHRHWNMVNLPSLNEEKEIENANERALDLGLPMENRGKTENQSENAATQNLRAPERGETVKSTNVTFGSSLKLKFLPKGSSFLRHIKVEVEHCLVCFDARESIDQILVEARLFSEQNEKDRKVVLKESNETRGSQLVINQTDKKLDRSLSSLSFSLPRIAESCDIGKNSAKSETLLCSNRPMFFISDRLEIDPDTGKKIFIGNFTLKQC